MNPNVAPPPHQYGQTPQQQQQQQVNPFENSSMPNPNYGNVNNNHGSMVVPTNISTNNGYNNYNVSTTSMYPGTTPTTATTAYSTPMVGTTNGMTVGSSYVGGSTSTGMYPHHTMGGASSMQTAAAPPPSYNPMSSSSTSMASFDPLAAKPAVIMPAPVAPPPLSPPQQEPPQMSPSANPYGSPTHAGNDEQNDVFGIFNSNNVAGSVVGKDIVVDNSRKDDSGVTSPRVVEEDETSVLSMNSSHHGGHNIGGGNQSVSTMATHSSRPSPLDDPNFAPPPKKTQSIENAQILARRKLSDGKMTANSPLPDFDKIQHSGYILGRFSLRTIFMKKWKQTFWIMYGPHTLYFFRSYQDFLDWVSNPYLTLVQRDFIVKMKIDFMGDLLQKSVRGYQVTRPSRKSYRGTHMTQFKCERWMDYGPTIAAAFASIEDQEAQNLRTVMLEIMKRGPQDDSLSVRSSYSGGASVRSAQSDIYGTEGASLPGRDDGSIGLRMPRASSFVKSNNR